MRNVKERKRSPRSAETCAKISAKMKGNKNPLGFRHTPEARMKMSKACLGKRPSPETRTKMSKVHLGKTSGMLGKKHSPETRAKMSAAKMGRKLSPEHCAKIGKAHMGMKRPLGTGAKISATRKARNLVGPQSSSWLGGISNLSYAWSFNAELKEEVRRRDGYKCRLCGVPRAECLQPLNVHHIDYDKKNSDPVNLVSLCCSCHARTNHNRVYWTTFFQNRMPLVQKIHKYQLTLFQEAD